MLLALAILFTSTAAFVWDEIIVPGFRLSAERPKLLNVILFLHWHWWTIGLLVLMVLLIQRHSYKLIHAAEVRAEKREQRSANVGVRDWIGEWTESERQFRRWESSDVFAEWSQGEWMIRSDQDQIARQEVYVACELAGSRLFNSPGMTLSNVVAAEEEHGKRWLYFLKETEGLNRQFEGSEGGGYIEHLAHISALACTKCASKAFGD